jgi:hypothetical protein
LAVQKAEPVMSWANSYPPHWFYEALPRLPGRSDARLTEHAKPTFTFRSRPSRQIRLLSSR